ncbi:MAG: hypothetical protein A3E01_07935 [Gammaproteobacteria bacterium RIFCSPHIGHO2_12_FULL_63_22]|nr:MAG: hypothetical protein A3E01_07935 [Gammaproteobacteria bacterium RIFCSPHIGHO2_12_FULL_63_22]
MGETMQTPGDPKSRLAKIFARAGVSAITNAIKTGAGMNPQRLSALPNLSASGSTPTPAHHISRDKVGDVLGNFRECLAAVVTSLGQKWRDARGLSGGGQALIPTEALLGRVMVSVWKLEAAERDGRGASVTEE